MRKAFISTLIRLAKKDKRIFLLTGDLGFSFLEEFRDEFPDRFFNMGVAEQNMIGVAAGIALSGKIVFVYSIVPFVTMRCFEQIRNDLCYHKLNVRIIGIGGGLAYGAAGFTHHAVEDIAIMRSLVNMTVIAPGDSKETEAAVEKSIEYKGPVYIRLGKGSETAIHSKLKFDIGRGILLNDGKDITIITSGSMLSTAKLVCEELNKKKISVRLISMPTIKPLDERIILKSAKNTEAIFTIEEHSLIGGLGSAIAEILAENRTKIYFKRIALPDTYLKETGSQDYLQRRLGLSVECIVKNILGEYKRHIRIS